MPLMLLPPAIPTLKDYLTVTAAAQLVGVSPSTLRNWDRQGKLRAARHPVNRYRLYERRTLEELLAEVTPLHRDGDRP